MSKFQQLVKGAASAIRKAQEELRALSAPEAQQVPEPPEPPKPPTAEERLAALAKNKFAGAPGGFKLYHGSPHTFEKFDFLNNLKRGEGALAFGPGGYMTGNQPLARQYAETLAGRGSANLRPPAFAEPLPAELADLTALRAAERELNAHTYGKVKRPSEFLSEAIRETPEDVMEMLRAKDFSKMSAVPRYRNSGTIGYIGDPDTGWRPGTAPTRIVRRDVTRTDFDEYQKVLQDVAGNEAHDVLKKMKFAGEPSKKSAQKMGAELRRALELRSKERGTPIVPRVSQKAQFDVVPSMHRDRSKMEALAEKEGRTVSAATYGADWLAPLVRNLNNIGTARSMPIELLPTSRSPLLYKPSWMQRGDLREYQNWVDGPKLGDAAQRLKEYRAKEARYIAEWQRANTPKRNLYELDAPFSPEDLLPYDYPLEYASPKVLGALARMAEDPELSAFLPSGMTVAPESVLSSTRGSDLMRHLKNFEPRDAAMAMKRAGIPGLYFERGGQRGGGLPESFDPDKYNFVIFDDEVLPVPKRTQFAHGGHAVK